MFIFPASIVAAKMNMTMLIARSRSIGLCRLRRLRAAVPVFLISFGLWAAVVALLWRVFG